jgi:iron(III) transport system substrate-binding protein
VPGTTSREGVARRTALLGSAALAAAALRPSGAVAADTDALVAAARQEGRVMLYSVVDPTLTQKLIAAFQQRYGITVDQQRMLGNPIAQRVAAEAQSGTAVGDMVVTTDPVFLVDAAAQGWVADLSTVPGFDAFPSASRTRFSAVVGHVPYSLVWNTAKVTTPPKVWKDLADPQWRGKLLMIDPRNGGLSPLSWYVLMRQTYGDDFIAALGKAARFVPSVVPGLQQIAAGAMAVYAPGIHQVFIGLAAKGAPIAEAFPDPTISSDNILGILAKAPHPNAARLLASFYLSRDGQALLNADGFSPLPDVPGTRKLPRLATVAPDVARGQLHEITSLLGLD